jgi:hypothetical protein
MIRPGKGKTECTGEDTTQHKIKGKTKDNTRHKQWDTRYDKDQKRYKTR